MKWSSIPPSSSAFKWKKKNKRKKKFTRNHELLSFQLFSKWDFAIASSDFIGRTDISTVLSELRKLHKFHTGRYVVRWRRKMFFFFQWKWQWISHKRCEHHHFCAKRIEIENDKKCGISQIFPLQFDNFLLNDTGRRHHELLLPKKNQRFKYLLSIFRPKNFNDKMSR